MYTDRNFKSKKQLKEAVAARMAYLGSKQLPPGTIGAVLASQIREVRPVTVYQPGPFGGNPPTDGIVCIEGPHYPEPHRFYATATLKNGEVVAVK